MTVKIDLHVHSMYSVDSTIRPEQLSLYAKKRGLDGVAVTDHDRLDSALKMSRESKFLILPGMEVTSLDGHIVGLNLKESVPKGLTAEETVDRIHDAGGIAIACHPSAFFKGSLGEHATSKFDAIEVINSSAVPFRYSVRHSEELASRLGISRVAGSDAHYGPEIGCAYTVVKAELETEDIISAIKKGMCQPFGKGIPLGIRLKREFFSFRKSRSQ